MEIGEKTVADDEQVKLLKRGAEAWNRWREENPSIAPDLRGADLRGRYFRDFNLDQADLRGARILGDSDLHEPTEDDYLYGDVRGYNSSNADFLGASLRGANLSGLGFSNLGDPEAEEDLKSIDLRGADLTGANLSECSLSGAKLGDLVLETSNWDLAEIGIEPYRQERTIIPLKLKDANLSGACLDDINLENFDLSGANFSRASLHNANLSGANLSRANLSSATFINAHLNGANLSNANLTKTELYDADLTYANLTHADLTRAYLDLAHLIRANLTGACLRHASLLRASLWEANLTAADLTGACIESWSIDSSTKLDEIVCNYVFLRRDQQERRPHTGNFKPGEFAALFHKALETVDLIFVDGVDWQAFFQSFQDLRSQYDEEELSIQAIEKKSGGAFVIRLEVPAAVDKGAIEEQARQLYENNLQLLEARYRAELHAKDREIEIYRQQSADMLEIVKLQASRPINPIAIAGSQSMGDRTINMGSGNYNERIDGNYIQGNYINMSQDLTQAAQQIQDLLQQLQNQGVTAEASQQQVATEMAKQAESNPAMMGKLVLWGKAMANKASETTVSEAAKMVLTLALRTAGIPLP
ncbi:MULTISPECIES: pentapeptide repeat-containing protein [Leptolyngbya]|uniref:pentapeptide repeat-containing protein n=1 Tax=Leptolyngbya TaxID=47251 RepID=UPI001688EB2D|nr:pentapeptide repeat-containing protein [Leptolyngbya sp. FACHB-1624]MBD1854798.1 pentapeptide repeat-containing protein [Leptolyngbya sp. FACHB-1624]